ncbi:uncharacterized protein LOC115988877 [Quercus lobata]|uniref:Neprosin PEP catalytic domain-containing protein n=1 Tax=Quercus lobata TaxID=97700 RepID=A0A7N2LPA9_QUELO|nr:uncharacterized protein LOC115988877 [Quercus lobata]
MANIINNKLEFFMLYLLTLSYMLSDRFVDGRSIGATKLVKHKGTIKTIETEDGDIIDCVDFYQQPAFDHPLLKNHIIQMKPSSIPSDLKANPSEPDQLFQNWHKSGQCPEATIPIRRPQGNQRPRDLYHFKQRRARLNHSLDSASDGDDLSAHEYATAYLGGNFHGAHATINVWQPTVSNNGEMSIGQIWVVAGPDDKVNTMEAGWRVDYDQKSKLFVYWTSDGYQSTGCHNLECPGFVQTNKQVALGSPIGGVSSYNSKQTNIGITIYKNNGNWWLKVNDQPVGYWPSSLFTYLANSATELTWGGEIYNNKIGGVHTKTQMGSGHFPSEGYGKASYFRNIQSVDSNGIFRDVEAGELATDVTKPSCYNINVQSDNSGGSGTNFYFGGPGYSDKCPK